MDRKLFFLLAAAFLAVGAVVITTKPDQSMPQVLRVAFPYAKPASEYEPARIHRAPEYIFLENIYSPLIETNAKSGQVEAGCAESFYWKGNDLHLVMRSGLKTVTGLPITAYDAEFSLKRLLVMPGNTHGNFRELICGNQTLNSVEDRCDGIRVSGNELILTTTNAGRTFLLPMLSAIDFAVIPKSTVDPATLKIIDFKNTSGPFYVARDSVKGELELRANPNHYRYSTKIPQVVEFVPTSSDGSRRSIDDFRDGRVDLLTTVDIERADNVIAFSRSHSDAALHTTMNIRSFVLLFSSRGLKEISRAERLAIGQKLQTAFSENMAGRDGFESSKQFFPVFSEGALSEEAQDQVKKVYGATSAASGRKLKMTLVRLGDTTKFEKAIKSALPGIEISEGVKNPNFLKFDSEEDMPHMAITGPDAGFLEDIGLITYSLNAGYFGMNETARKAWLEKYMNVQNKSERLQMLKALHQKALEEPVIIPLLVAPYAALIRKPWKFGLSQLYANNQLWLIETD